MNSECWTEMDLYWFQGGPVQARIDELFESLMPLWNRQPNARKGVTLCVGWLYDSVLYWNGDLDAPIPCCQEPIYETWTYRRLAQLVQGLHAAASRRSVGNFHVGLILMGIASQAFDEDATCEGWGGRTNEKKEKHHYNIVGKWFPEHSEVQDARFGPFYFGAPVRVPAGELVCIQTVTTFGEYFGCKLVHFTNQVGFDAVVFRDHIFSPAYRRGWTDRYMAPDAAEVWTQSFLQLFESIKRSCPDLVLIGYSSSTSSMEEWRSHGFDLERIAMTGWLDIWITQTWASAWQDYWPTHSMGFTFQLSNLLTNQAMLAKTPCKHLFLVETFDAWEPWDSIHQYPEKVAWEIWAYSHVATRFPGGKCKRPDGLYLSWLNHGDQLLPENTVSHVVQVLNDSAADIARDPIPGGPCLVYNREGLEALIGTTACYSRGEEMDDWTAMLQKYGLPILSITRVEWLKEVDADGFLFPVPVKLRETVVDAVQEKIEQGIALLFTGQAALLPEGLQQYLQIQPLENPVHACLPAPACVSPELAEEIETAGLVINQRQRTLTDQPGWNVWIKCLDGPVFASSLLMPCWIWETPEWGTLDSLYLTAKSIQSPQTYDAVARVFGRAGWGAARLRWQNQDWQKPVCFLFWRYPSGDHSVLLANLETGYTGNSQFAVKGKLMFQPDYTFQVQMKVGYAPGKMEKLAPGTVFAVLALHKIGMVVMREMDH